MPPCCPTGPHTTAPVTDQTTPDDRPTDPRSATPTAPTVAHQLQVPGLESSLGLLAAPAIPARALSPTDGDNTGCASTTVSGHVDPADATSFGACFPPDDESSDEVIGIGLPLPAATPRGRSRRPAAPAADQGHSPSLSQSRPCFQVCHIV